ncbi:MAG TPA: tetratricopeptide repeat protein [Candidatus Krumholzibacteria bacterium]|nr:tetratricopeptide repeat protein [Candidatus Krumholzibacteria bacterium]HPD71718.1 tetratricopeptide repeat protein [Candidatus Krumholzibacteria bacterium]HRY41349.1 tetratricopeptide repeat protein [Candidatus Krumholzibacteria bacterium]
MSTQGPDPAAQIAHFENRLQADPRSRAFLPLADLYRRTGQLDRARQVLERGLEIHPHLVIARAAFGQVLAELGEPAAATDALLAVVAQDPDNVLAIRLLAQCAAARDDWPAACECGERLLRLEPDDPGARETVREARRRLGTAAPAPDAPRPPSTPSAPSPARAAPSPAPDPAGGVRPESGRLRVGDGFETPTLADLYLRQGHPEKARAILERILAAEPDRADALEVMARLEARRPPLSIRPGAQPPGGDGSEKPVQAPPRTEPPPPPAEPTPAPGGRGQDLDRFRAWLDTAAEPRDTAG